MFAFYNYKWLHCLAHFLPGPVPVCQWTRCRRHAAEESREVQSSSDQEVSLGLWCRFGRLRPRGGGAAWRCYSGLRAYYGFSVHAETISRQQDWNRLTLKDSTDAWYWTSDPKVLTRLQVTQNNRKQRPLFFSVTPVVPWQCVLKVFRVGCTTPSYISHTFYSVVKKANCH